MCANLFFFSWNSCQLQRCIKNVSFCFRESRKTKCLSIVRVLVGDKSAFCLLQSRDLPNVLNIRYHSQQEFCLLQSFMQGAAIFNKQKTTNCFFLNDFQLFLRLFQWRAWLQQCMLTTTSTQQQWDLLHFPQTQSRDTSFNMGNNFCLHLNVGFLSWEITSVYTWVWDFYFGK